MRIFTPSFYESCKQIWQGLYLNYKRIFLSQALYRSYCSSLAAAHRPPPPQGKVVKILLFFKFFFLIICPSSPILYYISSTPTTSIFRKSFLSSHDWHICIYSFHFSHHPTGEKEVWARPRGGRRLSFKVKVNLDEEDFRMIIFSIT